MYIARLTISSFRGIEHLVWTPSRGINCLIGPGNSCKSTIIEAVALLFTPRRSVAFNDADFFCCDTTRTISIGAVIVDLPPALDNFETYGQLQCGWNVDTHEVHQDPHDDDERALSVRLVVDETLEPLWEAFKPGDDVETRQLRAGTREQLGVFRVEERPDHHLRWTRGSALSGLSGDGDAVGQALTSAHRLAREAVFAAPLEDLKATAAQVSTAASDLGATHFETLRPGLDPRAISGGGALVLHDGAVPLTSEGLGVRRLTSIAIQRLRAEAHSVFIIDEVEHGLEPHRLLRVLRMLSDRAAAGDQIFATTHSPTVVASLDATDLVVVRSDAGLVTASAVPAQLEGLKVTEPQGTVRTGPEAMLAVRVLVTEGATEEGFIRACTSAWDTADVSLALLGTAVRMGGNDEGALERATCLAQLGFQAAAMLDNDRDLTALVEAATNAGALVLRCPAGLDFEHYLVRDLPDEALHPLIELAVEIRAEADEPDEARVATYDQVKAKLPVGTDVQGEDPLAWVGPDLTLDQIRSAIGDAASARRWFKSQSAAAKVAALVLGCEAGIRERGGEGNFAEHLDLIRSFLYNPGGAADAAVLDEAEAEAADADNP